ncbi:MAG: hypothetical protein R2730_02935 [Chitinophagales bacterium]
MKGLIGFILIIVSLTSGYSMSLLEAIADEDIHVGIKKIEENNFMFPDKNLMITILNTSDKNIQIEIEPGYLLTASTHSTSDWVTVDQLKKNVTPNLFTEIGVKGMSLQKHLIEPATNSQFTCQKMVDDPIKAICEYIYQNEFNNSIGQDALWAVNMDQPIHAIDGPDEITLPIKHYIAQLLHIQKYDQPADKNLIYVADGKDHLRLLFEFEIDKEDEIKIEVLNANESKKECLVDRKYVHRFNHAIYYNLPLTDLNGEKLFVRSYQNDALLKEYIIVVEEENQNNTAQSSAH